MYSGYDCCNLVFELLLFVVLSVSQFICQYFQFFLQIHGAAERVACERGGEGRKEEEEEEEERGDIEHFIHHSSFSFCLLPSLLLSLPPRNGEAERSSESERCPGGVPRVDAADRGPGCEEERSGSKWRRRRKKWGGYVSCLC